MPLRLQALATLASLFFIAQQVHPSFGLGILSSLSSECCAPGFVQLSLSCHSGLISNVSFPPVVFTLSHFQVPVHCSKSPLPPASPPSHAEHWVSWECLFFLRCPFQAMSWFLAHCRGRDLFPPWTCPTQGPVRPMAMLRRTDCNSANSEAQQSMHRKDCQHATSILFQESQEARCWKGASYCSVIGQDHPGV